VDTTLAQTGISAWLGVIAVVLLLSALLMRRRFRGGPPGGDGPGT
jgi:LPXTG-motif cell wall-anchored protein